VIVVLLALGSTGISNADDHDRDDDQDWARDAVLSGKAIPLADIIASVEDEYGGNVYEVELMKSDDPSVAAMYRLKLVSEDGFLMELLAETSSGRIIGLGGQGIETGDGEGNGNDVQ